MLRLITRWEYDGRSGRGASYAVSHLHKKARHLHIITPRMSQKRISYSTTPWCKIQATRVGQGLSGTSSSEHVPNSSLQTRGGGLEDGGKYVTQIIVNAWPKSGLGPEQILESPMGSNHDLRLCRVHSRVSI